MQSVPNTNVVSLNPAHGEVYSIYYVINFVSDLWQVWFSPGTLVPSNNNTDLHCITEILLKVALNTITLTRTLLNKISPVIAILIHFYSRSKYPNFDYCLSLSHE